MNGENIYEWMLKYSKKPYANIDQSSIITTSNHITLNGIVDSIAGGHNGWNRAITWSKVSGGSATITSPNSDTTTVTGLSVGTYTFRLTSANASGGLVATRDVTVNVVSDCGYSEATYNPTVTASTNFSKQYLYMDKITFLTFKTFNLYSRIDEQSAGASSFDVAIPDRTESSSRGVGSGSIVYDDGTVKPIGCTATGTTITCKFEAISGSQGTIHISGEYK